MAVPQLPSGVGEAGAGRDRGRAVGLTAGDLETLGTYLFGPRWQSALARAIGCSARQVRRWLAAERQVSRTASLRIVALTLDKHRARLRQTNAAFLHMVAGISDPVIKERLLGVELVGLLAVNASIMPTGNTNTR
jgi:hypothetical protein